MVLRASKVRTHTKTFHAGLEWLDVSLQGITYAPHRHDTYTFALTIAGVQRFNYRGELHQSLPGQLVILHPDELHDGQQGDDRNCGCLFSFT